MRIKTDCKIRDIAGEKMIILQGKYGTDMTKIVSLNESAELLFSSLRDKEFSIADAAKVLTDNYEVEQTTAETDAKRWINQLEDCGIIIS